MTDAAGNVGSATQTLTITAGAAGDTGATGATGGDGLGRRRPGVDRPRGGHRSHGRWPRREPGSRAAPEHQARPEPTGATGPKGATGATGLTLSSAKLAVKHGKRVQVRVALSNPAKLTFTVMRGKQVVARMTIAHRKAGHSVLDLERQTQAAGSPPAAPTRSWSAR